MHHHLSTELFSFCQPETLYSINNNSVFFPYTIFGDVCIGELCFKYENMTVDSMEKMLLGKNRGNNRKLVRKYCR